MDRYTADQLLSLLPIPDEVANKYARGRLVLAVGSPAYPGAACLAAGAGQRMGAGYTEVVTDAAIVSFVSAYQPSLVVRASDAWMRNKPTTSRVDAPCAYVVGSGYDPHDNEAARMTHWLLKHAQAPVLLDGGALAAFCSPKAQRLAKRRFIDGYPTIITPHEGEAVRLVGALGLSVEEPEALACLLSLTTGAVVVLKGPVTWISDGDETYKMDAGTSALAKAGTGDVLAGMLGALLAQGVAVFDACVLATTLHAQAAQAASRELTSICVTAEDVITYLPHAIKRLGD